MNQEPIPEGCMLAPNGDVINIKHYQESLNKYPHMARANMADDGSVALTNCVYTTQSCACKIIGGGTLQFPMDIEWCEDHGGGK